MKKVDYISYYMGYEAVKDISLHIIPEFVEEVGSNEDNSEEECVFDFSDGSCMTAAFYPESLSEAECEAQKDALGVSTGCVYIDDVWLGAVAACGGVSKLPNEAQLNDLANYVYNTTGISGEVDEGITMDTDKVAELGFTGTAFYVWSGVNFNTADAGARYFGPSNTFWCDFARGYGAQAMCIKENKQEEKDYASIFCKKLEEKFNKASSDCSITFSAVQNAGISGTFKEITPHMILTNGLRIYIGSNYEEIEELSDAENEDDRKGFIIYVDVNGDSGKSELWKDVFPFYLLSSGKVVPAVNETTPAGGNSRDNLGVNVIYDDYSGENREVKLLMSDANFRSAACAAGYIKSAKYCNGREQYEVCKTDYHDCRLIVKEPIKIF